MNFFNSGNISSSKLRIQTSASTFQVATTKSPGESVFKFDNTVESGTFIIYTHTGSTPYYVDYFLNSPLDVTKIVCSSDDITGTLDLSDFSSVTWYDFGGNSMLTGVTFPTTQETVSLFTFSSCNLYDILDLTVFPNLEGDVFLSDNANLTSVVLPTNSSIFSNFNVSECDLRDVDASGLSGLGGSFYIYSNSNLTALTLPNSSEVFTSFQAHSCSNLEYVNFWPLSASSSNDIEIHLQNNTLSSSTVNHVLYDLDQIGWTSGTLFIGGTNAAPDGSSGGYDGTKAKLNLISNWWTVSTS